ncbi:MAG: DNA-binding protein [Candidatus Undinarchaeales archaeon]|nr:DNA-binding protein [Candidatus Undinarchaeales archaeon]MDP7491576.1 DNA-binding protein [Candidatus Undinarchaeales archaeon]
MRRRKLQEYLRQKQELDANAQLQQQMDDDAQRQQFDELKRTLFLKMLTEEARERLGRIRIARPDFVEQVEVVLIQLIQSRQITGKVDEKALLTIIKKIRGANKKEYRIIK